MKWFIRVAIVVIVVVGGLVGWNLYSRHMAQQEKEAQRQRLMQPQVEWVTANLDGHHWEDDGERQDVSAQIDNPCSLSITVKYPRETSVCKVNLTALPPAGVVVGIPQNSSSHAADLSFDDADAIDCTRPTNDNPAEHFHNFYLNFTGVEEERAFRTGFLKLIQDSCREQPSSSSSAAASPTSSIQATRSESKDSEFDEHLDPKHDKTSFIGTVVANECGTIGQPEECLVKDVKVLLSRAFQPEAVSGPGGTYVPPPFIDFNIKQLTVRLEDGKFLTMACAYETSQLDDAYMTHADFFDGDCWSTHDGEKVLFGRNGDTIAMRSQDFTIYLLALGNCESVHDCQAVPNQLRFSPDWKKSVAPWEWRTVQERKNHREYLETPR